MKQLYLDGELLYKSSKIIKGSNYIKGDNFEIRGISDWDIYSLGEGQQWDTNPEQEMKQRITDLELAMAAALGGA